MNKTSKKPAFMHSSEFCNHLIEKYKRGGATLWNLLMQQVELRLQVFLPEHVCAPPVLYLVEQVAIVALAVAVSARVTVPIKQEIV